MTTFFSIDELGEMPPPQWAVEGLFEARSLVMVAGPPGSFKSFLVLDWLLCMAAGLPWQGKQTMPSRVLYVLGEGRSSLIKRIQAWLFHKQLPPAVLATLFRNFKVTFDVPQMASRASLDNMLADLAANNLTPEVIAIDTFARSFVGMDENSQKDVGLWVENADRLRALGFTVIFLHHTTKNTEFGVRYRGSSAILGAMDTAILVQRDPDTHGGIKVDVTKQKDHDEGEPIYLVRNIIQPPQSEASIVLTPTVKMDERFTQSGQELQRLVDDALADDTYDSDRARARALAEKTTLSEDALAQRLSRRRKELHTKGVVPVRMVIDLSDAEILDDVIEQNKAEAAQLS